MLSGAGNRTPGQPNPGQSLACVQSTDADADGIPDAGDTCPNTANPGQQDTDGDGTRDACDAPDAPEVPALPLLGLGALAAALAAATRRTLRRVA